MHSLRKPRVIVAPDESHSFFFSVIIIKPGDRPFVIKNIRRLDDDSWLDDCLQAYADGRD